MPIINLVYEGYNPARLPAEYQEVEYIQSSWSQYIDTWYKTNINMKVQLWIAENTSYTYENAIFWDAWSEQAMFLMAYRWYYRRHFSFNWQNVATINWNYTELECDKTWITINWTKYNYTAWNTYSNNNIHIFNSWDNAQGSSRWRFSLYYFKMYDNWVLVRDFIPCYRKSDWVIWLRDAVNKQFYTNSWSWTFTKWPNV